MYPQSTWIYGVCGTDLDRPGVPPGGTSSGSGHTGQEWGTPPAPQRWAFVRIRPSEKCRPCPRTEPENQVDWAEARGGVDAGFVVVSPAAWGSRHRAPTFSLQPLWVEGAGKLEKLL